EFVTFLPHVQRVLYGEGTVGGRAEHRDSPIKVYRRKDIKQVQVALAGRAEPAVLKVAHVDLYFFYDADVLIVALEVYGDNVPLDLVQDAMRLFGPISPPGWTEDGTRTPCRPVAWLGGAG